MTVKLDYARIETVDALIEGGFERKPAETLLKTLSAKEHDQLCTEQEIVEMLNSVAKDTLMEMRREFDQRMEASDKRLEASEKRFEDEIKEMRSHKRWIVGTIITVGIAIIGYLQFIH